MPHYDRTTLNHIGKEASSLFLHDQVPLNRAIQKVAQKYPGLSPTQMERVVEATNLATNSEMMKKSSYTEFPLATKEGVLESWSPQGDTRGSQDSLLLGFRDGALWGGHDKTASVNEDSVNEGPHTRDTDTGDINTGDINTEEEWELSSDLPLFYKMASLYGVTNIPITGNALEDIRSRMESWEMIVPRALESLEISKLGMNGASDEIYQEIRQALLSGTSPDEAFSMIDASYGDVKERVAERLEAEGFIRPSQYEDDGPYSLQRMYKTASFGPESEEVQEARILEHGEEGLDPWSHLRHQWEIQKEAQMELEIPEDSRLHQSYLKYQEFKKQAQMDLGVLTMALQNLHQETIRMPNHLDPSYGIDKVARHILGPLEKMAHFWDLEDSDSLYEDLTEKMNLEKMAWTPKLPGVISKGVARRAARTGRVRHVPTAKPTPPPVANPVPNAIARRTANAKPPGPSAVQPHAPRGAIRRGLNNAYHMWRDGGNWRKARDSANLVREGRLSGKILGKPLGVGMDPQAKANYIQAHKRAVTRGAQAKQDLATTRSGNKGLFTRTALGLTGVAGVGATVKANKKTFEDPRAVAGTQSPY